MGRYLGPRKKYERRFGLIGAGSAKQKPRKRQTAYALQLEEKQKAKFIYGVSEKQFKKYVERALKSKNPNEDLMRQLETRLDNVVYRLGFAPTIPAARQLVSHGLIRLNGRKVDRPSYQARSGQNLSLDKAISDNPKLQEAWSRSKEKEALLPAWLWREGDHGKILNLPSAEEMRQDIKTVYIFEFYSK